MKRAARAAYWILPGIACLALYRLGLKCWFQQDDFAWLSLSLQVHDWQDLLRALFEPKAQGTIRPLSERAFFLIFYGLFGLNALPFRIAVFATQLANLVLVSAVARRLTKSAAAGFLAPVLWTANSVLAVAMSWTSAYNQILCAFFLLLSFYCLLRHFETGGRGWWLAQWVSFVLGFGALEINVVYPAIAAAYALCCARVYFRKTLWLFVPSIVFAAMHWHFAAKPAGGLYAMHFDASVFPTFWRYWEWVLGPSRLTQASLLLPGWLIGGATALLTLLLLGFAARQIARGERLALFLLLWFAIVLAPVLPLRDHVSDYYLTAPAIGLAILAAWGLAVAWKSGVGWRVAGVLAVSVYLAASVPAARAITAWNFERSRAVRFLVLGLDRVRQLHPGKVVLLTGVGADLFWAGIHDKPYRLVGLEDLYLVPGSEKRIGKQAGFDPVSSYVLPPAVALRALEEGRVVIYSAAGPRLRNVTRAYGAIARSQWSATEAPRRVDAGDPLYAGQLGPEWHRIEGRYRWMPKRATVRLGGPRSPEERLYLSGFCPESHLRKGPVTLAVTVNGRRLAAAKLTERDRQFEFVFNLPVDLVDKDELEILLELDRVLDPAGDGRELGLVFGEIAIR
jgi:hypothetical protein